MAGAVGSSNMAGIIIDRRRKGETKSLGLGLHRMDSNKCLDLGKSACWRFSGAQKVPGEKEKSN